LEKNIPGEKAIQVKLVERMQRVCKAVIKEKRWLLGKISNIF
jgi:hypothetical protein